MSSDEPSGHLLAMTDKVKAAFKVNFGLYLDFRLEVVQAFFLYLLYPLLSLLMM
jgi:hypothetical protein